LRRALGHEPLERRRIACLGAEQIQHGSVSTPAGPTVSPPALLTVGWLSD
jgi:hypothetical protein